MKNVLLKTARAIWLFNIAFTGFEGTVCAQKKVKWQKYYAEKLTPNAELIDAAPLYTVERDGKKYIKQTYFFDTKTVTERTFYLDAALKRADGPTIRYTDNGIKMSEGQYKNGKLIGEFLSYNWDKGFLQTRKYYDKTGQLQGTVTTYDSTGRIEVVQPYENDQRNGEEVAYQADGSIKYKARWKQGVQVWREPMDSSAFRTSVQPAYPCSERFRDQEKCGDRSLFYYIATDIHYPADAREIGIEGKVMVTFVVERDGSVSNIKVINGLCNSIAAEAKRVVAGMSSWIPARVGDEPVKVKFTLPISFKLD